MSRFLFFLIMIYIYPSHAAECRGGETLIASCILPGEREKKAEFCINKKTNSIYYAFKMGPDVQLKVDFTENRKLKRWVDKWTYTTYFGFNQGRYDYILGIPEEKFEAVAFLKIKKDGKTLSAKSCRNNSFGEKGILSNKIEDVSDEKVRGSGFNFP
ncbi:hypothetical protein [Erwinia billingiae]|uniref:hypothetical protein n=1 Tax=Erwinia billingiae TaxID=182337 RepID=UPI0022468807|nr:hypothetical protein [Erwinia billingiae]MCX0501614.1 hypothetical protein [Erwinia billingiae]